MAALTKSQRDALPDSDFAVPDTRDMPIHDQTHVKMAWKMVDRTKGLSEEQRKTARTRILHKAKELGIDTVDWNAEGHQEAMHLMAMSLNMPEDISHPNKMPFKGVLCKIDEPSDMPPNGSNGRRSFISREVAERSIDTLLGMAVDFTPDFDGHDRKNKIGIITEAYIDANSIVIEGFLYCADFPAETKRIQAEKNQLGMSYEAQGMIKPMGDGIVAFETCVFTGAAILYKDLAAYTTTSLAAAKNKSESQQMSDKDKQELQAQIDELTKKVKAFEAKESELSKFSAGSVAHIVKPHTDAIRAAASMMCAAGIGNHPTDGHGAHLQRMADSMDAQAIMGKIPDIYRDHDFVSDIHAKGSENNDSALANESKKAIEAIQASFEAKLSELTTHITDLKKARFDAAAAPERKTLSPSISALLAKADIKPEEDSGKFSKSQVSEFLKASNLNIDQKARLITQLNHAGKI